MTCTTSQGLTLVSFSAQLEHLRVYKRDELSGHGYTAAQVELRKWTSVRPCRQHGLQDLGVALHHGVRAQLAFESKVRKRFFTIWFQRVKVRESP